MAEIDVFPVLVVQKRLEAEMSRVEWHCAPKLVAEVEELFPLIPLCLTFALCLPFRVVPALIDEPESLYETGGVIAIRVGIHFCFLLLFRRRRRRRRRLYRLWLCPM